MEDLPTEAFIHVLSFVGSDACVTEKPQMTYYPREYMSFGPKYDDDDTNEEEKNSAKIRRSLASLASLRRVNRRWKQVLDGPVSSKLWFTAAERLLLDPPRQLYAGGSYQQVCQLLLQAEMEKEAAIAKTWHCFRTACILMPPDAPRPYPQHPRPEQPPVTLPPALLQRVLENAKALESFLGSVHYYTQTQTERELEKYKLYHHQSDLDRNRQDLKHPMADDDAPWNSHSAWNRYRMFLKLRRSHPHLWLVPTVDIEFCWIAHILRTETYWKDMTTLGMDPSHSLCLRHYGEMATFSAAVQGTEALWESTYGLSYLPAGTDTTWEIWKVVDHGERVDRSDPRRFFPKMGSPVLTNPPWDLPTIGLSAEEVQADLFWFPALQNAFAEMQRDQYNVLHGYSGRDARDRLLQQHVLRSYERFLNLCNDENMMQIQPAPPFVLDLVWHAHQLEPVVYKKDCLELFGREFWHHPWPHGLGTTYEVTPEFQCAWKTRYGTSIEEDWKLSLTEPDGPGQHFRRR